MHCFYHPGCLFSVCTHILTQLHGIFKNKMNFNICVQLRVLLKKSTDSIWSWRVTIHFYWSRRAPLVVADEAKLAIFSPTFFLFFFFLFSFFLRLLLFTHFGDTQEANFFSSPQFLELEGICKKKIIIFLNLNSFFYKSCFLLFTASVRSWKPEPPLVPGVFTFLLL